jgi:hypothetical protein
MSGKASAGSGFDVGSGRELGRQMSMMVERLRSDVMPTIDAWSGQAPGIAKEYGSQINEALKTGGVGAQIPIINRAVENSRQATSNTMRDLDSQFGKFNLSGTPYGEALRANTSLAGEQAAGNIPTDTAKQFIAGALPYMTATPGAAYTGQIVGAGQAGLGVTTAKGMAETNASMANKQAAAQLYSSLIGMVGNLAKSGGGGAGV